MSEGSLTEQIGPLLGSLGNADPMVHKSARDRILEIACGRIERLSRKILNDFPRERAREMTADISQSVAVKVCRYLDKNTPNDGRHFLRVVAEMIRCTIKDLARNRSRLATESVLGPRNGDKDGRGDAVRIQPIEQTQGPEGVAEWTEFHELVARLPDSEREVFDLRFYNGMSIAEIATLTGVSERTVKRQWRDARINLEKMAGAGPLE